MLIYKILHFMTGTVEFTADNGFTERFINLCTALEIPLWNVRRHGNRLYGCTSAGGYRKIRIPARKSGMKVRIFKKSGLPFFIFRHRDRTGLLIGFAVMFVALFLLSGHVWVIEVDGNTATSSQLIEETFSEAGLTVGCNPNRINIQRIKSDALIKLKTLTWVSINIRGSTAVIEVREAKKSPAIEETAGTSNIVASKDGQVEIIEPYKGTPAVKPGQTVLKGDLLVSGITESRIQTYIFDDAKGYIAARTNIPVFSQADSSRKILVPSETKVYSLSVLGKEIPLGRKRDAQMTYTHRSWLYIGKKRMPFGIIYTLYTDFSEEEKTAGTNQVRLTAINNYLINSYRSTMHAQIISDTVKLKQTDKQVKISGNYSCFENIGQRIPIETEEIPEASDSTDEE